MGNANTGRTPKKKGVLRGLFSFGSDDGADREEAAPRTGISLRNRFSALDPVASPTEAIPPKISEDVPSPDIAKEKKVIHTSAVRSIRFSDRIGFPMDTGTDDNYDRSITFDDDGYDEEEEISETAERYVEERCDPVFEPEEEYAETDVPEMCEAEGHEEEVYDIGTTELPEEDPVVTMPSEYEGTYADTDTEEITEYVQNEAADTVEEITENIQNRTADVTEDTPAVVRTVSPNDDFDGGYDFLPRRNTSGSSAVNRVTEAPIRTEVPVRAEAPIRVEVVPDRDVRAEVAAVPVRQEASTSLEERMRARHAGMQQRRSSEIQADAPVQHECMSRTSLLDKVTRERSSVKSVSELIRCTEVKDPAVTPTAMSEPEEMEECVAEVSVERAVPRTDHTTYDHMLDEMTVEEAVIENITDADTPDIRDTEYEFTDGTADAEDVTAYEDDVAETVADIEAEMTVDTMSEAEIIAEEVTEHIEAEAVTDVEEMDISGSFIEIEEITADYEAITEEDAQAEVITECEVISIEDDVIEYEAMIEVGEEISDAGTEIVVTDAEVETEVTEDIEAGTEIVSIEDAVVESETRIVEDIEEENDTIAETEITADIGAEYGTVAETEIIERIIAEMAADAEAKAIADAEVETEVTADIEADYEAVEDADVEYETVAENEIIERIIAEMVADAEAKAIADAEVETEFTADIEVDYETVEDAEIRYETVDVEAEYETAEDIDGTDVAVSSAEAEVIVAECDVREIVAETDILAEEDGYALLNEIYDDAPVLEDVDDESRFDDAERQALALSYGVIVDNEVVPTADVRSFIMLEGTNVPEDVPEEMPQVDEAPVVAEDMQMIALAERVPEVTAPVERIREEPALEEDVQEHDIAEVTSDAPEILYATPEITAQDIPDDVRDTEDDMPDNVFGICFSFISEENTSSSTSVNFVWGQ